MAQQRFVGTNQCGVGTSGVAVMIAAYFQSVGRAKEALFLALEGILLVKLPALLLTSRLFALNGIWASEVVSELILCVVSLMMLKDYQGKTYLEASVEQA